MTAQTFTFVFLAALALGTLTRLGLMLRHMRHVQARHTVPADFAQRIPLDAHRKAADYTCARLRLGLLDVPVGVALLLAWTLGGGIELLHGALGAIVTPGSLPHGVALLFAIGAVGALISLPFAVIRVFVIERRFGFNRSTPGLFVADRLRAALLALVIGTPVLFAILWLMQNMGSLWWFWVWLFWLSFNLVAVFVWPTFIAPLFNRFTPLDDATLKQRIEALMARCGFRSSGLFVMDGSRRSTHGNAYFTGFGAAKRIVFFDTLLERLGPGEIEAVLAHELGHYRLHHIWQRLLVGALSALVFLGLLAWLMQHEWYYAGLGVQQQDTATALALYMLALPVFTFFAAPLGSHWSRVHEFEADRYAASHARADDLISALVKLYRDNASTLTPDPLYSRFFDSHPPATIRISRLRSIAS